MKGASDPAADRVNGVGNRRADRRNGVGNRRADRRNGTGRGICWECNGVPITQYCECRDGPRRRRAGRQADRWVRQQNGRRRNPPGVDDWKNDVVGEEEGNEMLAVIINREYICT